MVFSVQDIPTIEDLLSETNFSGTQIGSAFSNITPSTPVTLATVYGVKAGAKLTFVADSLMVIANSTYSPNPSIGTTFRIDLMRNGSYYSSIRSIFIQAGGYAHYISTNINYVLTGVPDGTYSVRLSIETSPNTISASADISESTLSWNFTQAGIRYFQFGVNGMMAYFSDNHWYFTEFGGFDLRGKTNMPGVLLSATVSSTGGFAYWWGAKKHSTNTATRNSTGHYTVYHSIGHSNYQIAATAHSANRSCYIVSKGTDNLVIEWRTIGSSPALSDTTVDIVLTGNNYIVT